MTNQVTKVFLNHELEGFCRAGCVAGDHGTAGHDMADGCRVGIEAFCGDSVREVLGGEYAAKALVIVYDKNTVGALGGA